MTIQDWAVIAIAISAPIAAIATLLAPTLAEIVKFRINQPKPSPEANIPKSRNRFIRSFWFPFLTCLFGAWPLVDTLRSPEPVTPGSVFVIAYGISSILVIILAAAVFVVARRIIDSMHETALLQLQSHEIARRRIDLLEETIETLASSLFDSVKDDTVKWEKLIAVLQRVKLKKLKQNSN